MAWNPISEEEVRALIDEAWRQMNASDRRLWEAISFTPEKWAQHPWGDKGDGFWVVAVIGRSVIWYNDIEEGFNISRYTKYGTIDEYWCNQDELRITLINVNCLIREYDRGKDVDLS